MRLLFFFRAFAASSPSPPRPSTVTCAPLLMFHNPFCPTAQAPPGVLRIPVKSTGNKSTQTLCVSDKASQTRKRTSGRTKSRAAQTSTRFFQNNKYSQTEKCVVKKKKRNKHNANWRPHTATNRTFVPAGALWNRAPVPEIQRNGVERSGPRRDRPVLFRWRIHV